MAKLTPKETDEFLQRINDQSVLMLQIKQIIDDRKSRQQQQEAKYKQLLPVRSDDPHEFINNLFNRGKINEYNKLLDLNSAQLSSLIPKIKIFKQYVDVETKKTYDVEYFFEDHLTEKSLASMVSTRKGRGGGAGIKSFSWEADGKTTAETSLFRATLVLYFQSLSELFETREIVANPPFGDKTKPLEVKFLDLISQQPTMRLDALEGERTYNPDYFRIKVNVGWQVLHDETIFDKETIRSIEDLNETFFLTIYSHNLTFDKNGGVTLTIEYRSYTEACILDPTRSNIFGIQSEVLEKIKKKEELENQQQQSSNNNPDKKKQDDKKNEAIEEMDKEITKLKTNMYSQLMQELIVDKKIWYTYINTEQYNQIFAASSKRTDSVANRAEVKEASLAARSNRASNAAPQKVSAETSKTLSDDVEKKVDPENRHWKEKIGDLFSEIGSFFGPDEKHKQEQYGTYFINFFYLGDLLEVCLRNMYNPEGRKVNFLEKTVRTILGPITFYDAGTLEDSGNAFILKGKKTGDEKVVSIYDLNKTSVNIADIPISLSLFNSWFITNIVEVGHVNFTFRQFLERIINDLVVNALGQETNLPIPTQKIKLSYKCVDLTKKPKREDVFYKYFVENQEIYARDFNDKIGFVESGIADTTEEQDTIQSYLIVYGTSEKIDRERSIENDKKSGIYDMIYGSSTGLVKKIEFDKQDIPQFNSYLMHKAYAEQQGDSTLLRGIYNAEVEMFGNTLYELGSAVYIHPNLPGFSDLVERPEESAINLGIGGYYTVTKIKNTIDLTSYSTNLELMWNSRGDGSLSIGKYSIPKGELKTINELRAAGKISDKDEVIFRFR